MSNKPSERGNILWILMIAVALLAAVTMVISRGGSSSDQTGAYEQRSISSSQILRYAKGIETAIQNMKLQGVSENDISFENATTTTSYTNAACSSGNCMLFDVSGAGLSYQDFAGANDGSEWIFTGANNVGTTAGPVGTTAASSGNDLVMLLPNVSEDLCIQINRELGVGTAGTLPIDADGIAVTAFTGAYPGGGPTVIDVDDEPAGCFKDGNDSDKIYFYYTVLTR